MHAPADVIYEPERRGSGTLFLESVPEIIHTPLALDTERSGVKNDTFWIEY